MNREEARPFKPRPPGPHATIDRQQAYDRINHEVEYYILRVWEYKQSLAYHVIITSCAGQARRQAEKHKLGQVAFTVLRELFEPLNHPQVFRTPIFNGLCHIRRSEYELLDDFARRTHALAVASTQNGYGVPDWMLCLFFRVGLELGDGAEGALMSAEGEGRVTDVAIEDIVVALKEHEKQAARACVWSNC